MGRRDAVFGARRWSLRFRAEDGDDPRVDDETVEPGAPSAFVASMEMGAGHASGRGRLRGLAWSYSKVKADIWAGVAAVEHGDFLRAPRRTAAMAASMAVLPAPTTATLAGRCEVMVPSL